MEIDKFLESIEINTIRDCIKFFNQNKSIKKIAFEIKDDDKYIECLAYRVPLGVGEREIIRIDIKQKED